MKRIFKLAGITCIIFVINIVLLVGVIGLIAVNAGSGPSGNGDVNGDGGIDLGDAVYLLSYLFEEGPEPVAIAGEPSAPVCWPPHPENIVHLAGPTIPLLPGEQGVIYSVPTEYYLVVTNFYSQDGNSRLLRLLEDDGVSTTIRFNVLGETSYHPPYSSSVGIPFSPGSDVVVEAEGGDTTFGGLRRFELTGYLVPVTP